MINLRISKYNPKNRDNSNNYLEEDWISYSDIGKVFNNKTLTKSLYLDMENRYINSILVFLNFFDISTISLTNLEKYHYKENTDKELNKIFEEVNNNDILSLNNIKHYIRLALRGYIWCEFHSANKIKISFGYDYYIYISILVNSIQKITPIINNVENLGLYLEEIDNYPIENSDAPSVQD